MKKIIHTLLALTLLIFIVSSLIILEAEVKTSYVGDVELAQGTDVNGYSDITTKNTTGQTHSFSIHLTDEHGSSEYSCNDASIDAGDSRNCGNWGGSPISPGSRGGLIYTGDSVSHNSSINY